MAVSLKMLEQRSDSTAQGNKQGKNEFPADLAPVNFCSFVAIKLTCKAKKMRIFCQNWLTFSTEPWSIETKIKVFFLTSFSYSTISYRRIECASLDWIIKARLVSVFRSQMIKLAYSRSFFCTNSTKFYRSFNQFLSFSKSTNSKSHISSE